MKSSVFATLAMSLTLLAACAQKEVKKPNPAGANETSKTAVPPVIQGSHYTTLIFPKGKSELGQENRKVLQEFKSQIHKSNKAIDEIRVLVWADTEYPDKVKGKVAPHEVNLASERAQNIKSYLEDNLNEESDIDAYNMAKRPDLISKLLRDDEYEVKEAFESSGTTASKLPSGAVSYTKASKALVIIEYEGEKEKQKN